MSTTEPIETETTEGESSDAAAAIGASVKTAMEGLRSSADVRSVYGDPIAAEGKTIVPVARIAYGFGGGFGSAGEDDSHDAEGGEGGSVAAKPVGVVEVTEGGTRFVRFTNWRRLALAAAGGVAIGYLLGRR